MANNNNYSSPRGVHVSPGIYTSETDLNYAVRSLGITTLGVVGETVKGPAFQIMDVSNWREYQDIFGGTSTEKFKGSQYPKYELPYIAKSYLSESEQLKVVRVLGLSGYNAGPAWLVVANNNQVIAVLRSRGTYNPYKQGDSSSSDCGCKATKYDTLNYLVGEISGNTDCAKNKYNLQALQIDVYTSLNENGDCESYEFSQADGDFNVSELNHGKFKIKGITGAHGADTKPASGVSGYFEYSVSLNKFDKDYILKVLGTNADDADAPIFVEALYDVALEQGIKSGEITFILNGETTNELKVISGGEHAGMLDGGLQGFQAYTKADYCRLEPVYGLMTVPQDSLTKKWVGKRVLADKAAVDSAIQCVKYVSGTPETDASGNVVTSAVTVGQIYTVKQYTAQDGKRHYFYGYVDGEDKLVKPTSGTPTGNEIVMNLSDGLYYRMRGNDVDFVSLDLNDYKSAYRYASTPWIVSNLKGDGKNVEVNKLFRFHTISDGNNANYEIKVSIENIKPDEGTFDVNVRRIDDLDESIILLESFRKCTMIPKDSNYIAFKIGSFDGVYEPKSKYITVEVNETTAAKNSVPAGFMGYPIPKYDGLTIGGLNFQHVNMTPPIKYNTMFDEEIKNRKQYFGLSSWVGVDIDNFTFKGNMAYINRPEFLSNGFHLDSRLDAKHGGIPSSAVTVDGESGYTFDSVSTNSRTMTLDGTPIIDTEENMYGSIYQNVNLRKFTVFFYGGFDGWDVYRDQRTNGDAYKATLYKGYINSKSGEGYAFDKIQNPEALALNQNGITSDFYAYLSGIRQFANPEASDINVFATPGIDYVNQKLLVQEAIDMIEEERADSIYVATTPDKPNGAGDYVDEMYTPEEAVANLEDSDIDSNYTCTYYPWIKYLDQENNQYIFLPPTKDAVRNFAQTDNQAYPWFAPAGINRGEVDCIKAKFITKLADEDTLYEGRINPIKTFAQDGPKIWGQKNLQINESQLNRIAVRRLLLRLRKLVAISCIGLIFEPNDNTVKQSFISAVTPILESIRNNRGISDYRIEVNDSIESRERRELPAKIYFKPYNALEYITIDFVLTPEGVSFDNI